MIFSNSIKKLKTMLFWVKLAMGQLSSFYQKHFNLESFNLVKNQENLTLFYQVRRSLFLCFHGNPCDCCKRVSTIWYQLVLSQINSIDLISKLNFRKHGVRMTVLNRVVCQTCLSYLTEKKPLWRNAAVF